MIRSSRSTLWSTPLATMTIAALALWGCGGGDGGGGTAGAGGTHVDGGAGAGGKAGGGGGATAGTGGKAGGAGGSAAGTAGGGTGGGAAGAGGSAAGAGGSAVGAGGSAAGAGGSAAGAGGGAAGAGGGAAGAGGKAGSGGAAAGAGGSAAGAGGGAAGASGTPFTCTNGAPCALPNSVRGICASNACVACTTNATCAAAYSADPICVSGNCVACGAATDCNDTTKVCAANTCSGCSTTADCTGAYGANHVCSGTSCVSGNCLTTVDCVATGHICGAQTALSCGTCTLDADCMPGYGAGYICNGGACITGNCHTSANCGAGLVCDLSSHTCGGCGSGAAGDTTCQGDAKYGSTYICQANACIVGNCHTAATCNNTAQVCNSFTCGMCSTTTDCTNAYGANHVCSGGACISGNCNNSGQCGGNQLCINHACTACTAGATGDSQCVADTTYGAMHICLAGQCLAGNCHDTSGECMNGQLCGISTAHTCGSCGTGTAGDNACKGDTTYGSGDICLSGACTPGDCHDTSTDCTAGKICGVSTAHTCGNCGAGSTGDMQCTTDARYGGDICFQGLCGPGNCHASSSDCTGANAGLICGASAANTCGSCTSDSQCKSDSFYGSGDICNTTTGKCVTAACSPNSSACSANGSDFCCGASCVPGNCCVDGDCGAAGTACVGHVCSACNAASGNKWYVDPANGNDLTATGSDMSGGIVAPGCAYKTITQAIAHMPAVPFAGSQIIIIGASGSTTGLSAGDTLPIILPTNTTLTTTGGPITITLATPGVNNPGGFRLNNNGSGITGGAGAPLVLDGNNHPVNGGIAIEVSPGTATFTSNVSNVTIQNTNGDGIRVTAGTLTVGAGVVVSGSNQDGIRISGGAANINNPAGAQTLFTGNAQHGIEVSGLGSVSVTGTPGTPIPINSGTVVASGNTTAGIRINQTPGGAGLVTNNINGLVAWGNTNYGMRLFGGSLVKVRNSILLGNLQYGVIVGGNNVASGDDVTKLDLGKAGDPGKNWIQTPVGAAGANANGGLCVALANCTGACLGGMGTITENVSAEGNEMVSTTNTQADCSTSTATVTKGGCGAQRSDGINAATNVTTTVDVAGCM